MPLGLEGMSLCADFCFLRGLYFYGEEAFPTFVKYTSQSVMGMVGISCYILAGHWFRSPPSAREGLAALNLAIVVYSSR